MSEPHYHINLFGSDEDGLWIADVPDLRGCTTHGATSAAAIKNAAEAIEGWLETAHEVGLTIPEPKYRRAIYAARDAACLFAAHPQYFNCPNAGFRRAQL